MNLGKRVALNTVIQISGKAVSTILGLFAIALITRYLGTDGFGEYTTVITFLTFFAVASDFGLTLVTAQMISGLKDKIKENKVLGNLFSFRLLSIIVFISLAPATIGFFPYPAAVKLGVIIAFLSFIFPALNQVIIGLFQKRLHMENDVIAEALSRVILLAGVILTENYKLGLNGILISTLISSFSSFIFHFIFARRFASIRLNFDWEIWKRIINKAWPLSVTIVLNLIYLRADILFLSLFQSQSTVGLYGAAYKVIDVLTTVPFMFAGLILPIITVAWLDNKPKQFKNVLQKSLDFMIILVIPLVIGVQFLGKPLMIFIAGQNFVSSGLILQILIFAVAAVFIGTIFSHAIVALDKQKKMIGFYVFTSITSLIAYLILIPRFSYWGAAAVTIYSETLIMILSAYCVYKYSHFSINFRKTGKALLSGALMGLLLYFWPLTGQHPLNELITAIVAASLIYFSILFLIGGINQQDLKTLFKKGEGQMTSSYGGSL